MAMANISLTDSSHYLHKLSELAHQVAPSALPEKKNPCTRYANWIMCIPALATRRVDAAAIGRIATRTRDEEEYGHRSCRRRARLPGAISPGASSKLGCRSMPAPPVSPRRRVLPPPLPPFPCGCLLPNCENLNF